jgi:hypothetical protein
MAGVALSESGVAENGMGTAWGDYDNDGHLDLTVTNYADQMNSLYHNDGDGFFSDVSTSSQIGRMTYPTLAWATEFVDYDNDGWLDLFVANGHLHDNLAELHQKGTYGQRNVLFHNNRDGTFREVSLEVGPGFLLEEVSRGTAFADYDLDGDLDLVVTNSHGPARLLRNDGGNRNHWLAVRLLPTHGTADSVGVRVILHTGTQTQMREVSSGAGYLSQSDRVLLFGLGDHMSVDRIEVRWPRGSSQTLDNVPANQTILITQPSAD